MAILLRGRGPLTEALGAGLSLTPAPLVAEGEALEISALKPVHGLVVVAAEAEANPVAEPWSAAFFAAAVATDDLFRAAAGRLADDAKVVVVLSAGALDACAEPPPRAAAMAAARNLAQSWAFTLAPRGITVNAVCLPPRPSANPQGLITLVRFLLSPAAADITAQTLQLG